MKALFNESNHDNTSGEASGMDHMSIGVKASFITAYAVIIPIAIIGNIFVVRTVVKVPLMRTPTNLMFVNMALFDIIVAVTMMPYQISWILYPYRWIGGLAGTITCKLTYYAFFISIAGSILSLVVMAFDRFFAIVLPLHNVRFFRRYKLLTFIVWSSSMIFMLPIAILQEITKLDGEYLCHTNWWKLPNGLELYRAFIASTLVILYLFPVLTMAILYSLIAHRLWFTKIPGMSESMIHNKNKRRAEEKKRKIVKMLMIVLLVFFLCWLPVHIQHFLNLADFTTTFSKSFQLFAFWLSHANSAINPCLYILLHSGFRRAFLQLFPQCSTVDETLSRINTCGTVMTVYETGAPKKKQVDSSSGSDQQRDTLL